MLCRLFCPCAVSPFKIYFILQVIGRERMKSSCQIIISFRLFLLSQSVIDHTKRNRRKESVAVFLDKGSGIAGFFCMKCLFIPVNRLFISFSVKKMSPKITAGFAPGHVICQTAQQSFQRIFLLFQSVTAVCHLSGCVNPVFGTCQTAPACTIIRSPAGPNPRPAPYFRCTAAPLSIRFPDRVPRAS